MAADKTAQIEKAERLQDLLLDGFLARLANGTLSDTGMATLARLLMANGWTLDPSRVPQELKDKLVSGLDPDDDTDGVEGVIPFPLARQA